MNPDNLQQTWQAHSSQTRLTIDAQRLLKEVRRNQWYFTATIFWRDVREVGTAMLLVPLWFYLGMKLSLPWTWYLMVPALVWIAGYMLADRIRHKRQPPEPSESLRQGVETSLEQVEHQIWLLRNVLWWYLLPLGLPMLAFFGQLAWEARSGGWLTALAFAGMFSVEMIVLACVYRLNQSAVRSGLEPRRQELEALLMSLKDETAASWAPPQPT
jgi:hypothetical protein